jgi:hypothetical protein
MQGSAYPLYDHRHHPTSPTQENKLPQALPVSPSFNSISILPNKKPRQSEAQSGHNNIIHHGRKSGRAAFFLFGRDNPPELSFLLSFFCKAVGGEQVTWQLCNFLIGRLEVWSSRDKRESIEGSESP